MQEELLERHHLELVSLRRAEDRVRVLLLSSQETQRASQEAYDSHLQVCHALMEAQAQLKAAVQRERIAREKLRTPLFEKQERVP